MISFRLKKQASKNVADTTFKKGTSLNKPRKIVNEKNIDKNKKYINFAVSINSVGKMLWQIHLGQGHFPVPIRP